MHDGATSGRVERDREIDRTCDRFEANWKSGRRPSIELYLRQVDESIRPECLRALLLLELDLRRSEDDDYSFDEYLSRFPEYSELTQSAIEAHLAAGDGGKSADPSPAVTSTRHPRPDATQVETVDKTSGQMRVPKKFGRYRVRERLGAGAMGTVLLADDPSLDRQVAIKVPHLSQAQHDPEVLERFVREARSAAQLRHPNICPVHDVGKTQGLPFIAMGYIDGRPLSRVIADGLEAMSERDIARLVFKLALALQEAHAHGVVHRDIKPANIMLDSRREPILMDFGLALQMQSLADVRLTHTGVQVGSPAYMSPEQVDGNPQQIGSSTDIYSLGVVLYELLTGQVPFDGPISSILALIVVQAPTPPSELKPGLSLKLESICLKMMEKKPEDRYGSMENVASELAAFLRSEPGAATDASIGPSTVVQQSTDDDPALEVETPGGPSGGALSSVAALWKSLETRHRVGAVTVGLLLLPALTIAVMTMPGDDGDQPGVSVAVNGTGTPNGTAGPQSNSGDDPQVPAAGSSEAEPGETGTPDDNTTNEAALEVDDLPISVMQGESPLAQFATLTELTDWCTTQLPNDLETPVPAPLTIQLAAGCRLTGPLQIDVKPAEFPEFELHIVAPVDAPAVITGDGQLPVLDIKGIHGLSITGVDIRAVNADTGIRCTGPLQQIQLNDLAVRGFESHGLDIRIDSRTTPDEDGNSVVISGCRFRALTGNGAAIAVPDDDTTQIQITGCRFSGPLDAAVVCSGGGTFELSKSIFAGSKTGLRLDGTFARVTDVTISHNTFFEVTNGIEFQSPSDDAGLPEHLTFTSNLFSKTGEFELRMPGDKSVNAFSTQMELKSENNFTDSPPNIGPMMTNDIHRWRKASIVFASTDKDDQKYLAPVSLMALADTGAMRHLELQQLATLNPSGARRTTSITFNSTGDLLACGHSDGTATVWSVTDGQKLFDHSVGQKGAIGVCLSPDGQRLLTCGGEANANVWSVQQSKLHLTLKGHTDRLHRAVFSPNGDSIATASADGSAALWSADSGHVIRRLRGGFEEITDVAFSLDGQLLAAAGTGAPARIWSMDQSDPTHVFDYRYGSVVRVMFHPNGTHLITNSRAGHPSLCRIGSWTYDGRLSTGISSQPGLPAVLADGDTIAIPSGVFSRRHNTKLYRPLIRGYQPAAPLITSCQAVPRLAALQASGEIEVLEVPRLASGCAGGTTPEPVGPDDQFPSPSGFAASRIGQSDMVFTDAGLVLAAVVFYPGDAGPLEAAGTHIELLSRQANDRQVSIPFARASHGYIRNLKLADDGGALSVITGPGVWHQFNTASAEPTRTTRLFAKKVITSRFSQDGSRLAVVGSDSDQAEDTRLRVWDTLQSGSELILDVPVLPGSTPYLLTNSSTSVVLPDGNHHLISIPDGKSLLSSKSPIRWSQASDTGDILATATTLMSGTGEVIRKFSKGHIRGLSRTGDTYAVVLDRNLQVRRTSSGRLISTIHLDKSEELFEGGSVRFSADSSLVVFGGAIWSAARGRLLDTVAGGLIASSQDGRQLAFRDAGQIHLWSPDKVSGIASLIDDFDSRQIIELVPTPSPDPIGVLQDHSAPIQALAFSAEGSHLVSVDQRGEIHLRDLAQPDKWSLVGTAKEQVVDLVFSDHILTLNASGSVSTWDLRLNRGRSRQLKADSTAGITATDEFFALATPAGAISVFEAVGFEPISSALALYRRLPVPGRRVSDVAISSNGRLVAAMTLSGRLIVWDLSRGTERLSVPKLNPDARICFTDDESTLIVGDESLQAWNVEDAKVSWKVKTGHRPITDLYNLPGDFAVVAVHSGGDLTIWTGNEPPHRLMHVKVDFGQGANRTALSVNRLLATPDGHRIRLWRLPGFGIRRIFGKRPFGGGGGGQF